MLGSVVNGRLPGLQAHESFAIAYTNAIHPAYVVAAGVALAAAAVALATLRAEPPGTPRPRAGLEPAGQPAQVSREVPAGEGGAGGDQIAAGALEDDAAALVTRAGAEIDDPVGVRHDRLVVVDDDDRLAGVDQPVEQRELPLDVGQVQAGGRLVQDVHTALLAQVRRQLEPLALAGRKRRERLAEAE